MPPLKDYYKELGVDKAADADTIKKAYRKLALKEHPDRGGDAEKFKAIGEAFAVLSDEQKRAEYDEARARGTGMPGAGGFPPRGQAGGFAPGGGPGFAYSFGGDVDPHEIFASFFGSMGGMPGGMGGMRMNGMEGMGRPQPRTRAGSAGPQFRSPAARAPALVTHELRLSLEELMTGCVKKMRVTRTRAGQPDSKLLEIEVKPGWKAGTKITFPGEGDQLGGPGTPAGDIQFVVAEKPHARFKRVGNDLEAETRATLKDVVRGSEVELAHVLPSQPPLRATLDQVQLEGSRQIIRFPGRGMPVAKGGKPGDAVLVVKFAMPSLSSEQREQICAVLDSRGR